MRRAKLRSELFMDWGVVFVFREDLPFSTQFLVFDIAERDDIRRARGLVHQKSELLALDFKALQRLLYVKTNRDGRQALMFLLRCACSALRFVRSGGQGAAMLGHSGAPAQFILDALAQHVGSAHLAMHHINLVGCVPHAAQPGQGLVGVGMG